MRETYVGEAKEEVFPGCERQRGSGIFPARRQKALPNGVGCRGGAERRGDGGAAARVARRCEGENVGYAVFWQG